MRWSLTIGRFGGTAVKIHVTFLLLLAWIGFSAWRQGGPAAARDSLVFIILMFVCVVLHEFGHILVARRYGIQAPEVTLLPIGGVASLQALPEKPSQEFAIAIAGPAVNFVIAVVLLLLVGSFDAADLARLDDPRVSLLARLADANLFLAVFNLIPAFPMDGGRVLRALLAMKLGRRARHPHRRLGRPGLRLRARLPRPVRQSAADLHRHLRLCRRRGRGADDGDPRVGARAQRRPGDGDALRLAAGRRAPRRRGRRAARHRPARVPGGRRVQQADRPGDARGHFRRAQGPGSRRGGRRLHARADRDAARRGAARRDGRPVPSAGERRPSASSTATASWSACSAARTSPR